MNQSDSSAASQGSWKGHGSRNFTGAVRYLLQKQKKRRENKRKETKNIRETNKKKEEHIEKKEKENAGGKVIS